MREVRFDYEGKDYVLAFTRESVKEMENAGFDFEEAKGKVLNTCEKLFYGAFAVYHRGIKRKLVDEIWANMDNKEALVEELIEMVSETVENYMKCEADNPKKISWEVAK